MRVIVCGGGFAGLYSSCVISNSAEIYIIEEHDRVGENLCCSGLVSKRVIDNLYIDPPILNKIRNVDIISPSGKIYSISLKNELYVIDRIETEIRLMERCLSRSANIVFNARVIDISKNKVLYRHGGNKYEISGEIILGADGPNSVIRRKAIGIKSLRSLIGIQLISKRSELEDTIKIYVSQKFSDGLFGWEIPRGDCKLVGLATYTSPLEYFRKFTRSIKVDERKYCIKPIPVNLSRRIENDCVMLVGDSAGMCKPTSGGGLYPSIVASNILGEIIAKNSRGYQDKFYAMLGRKLKLMSYINALYRKTNDKVRERLLRLLENEYVLRKICEYGDVDYPYSFILGIFRPRLP